MKKYPPFADHELWRLDGIAKGGEIDAMLNYHQISTVGEFIRRLNSNPTELRGVSEILYLLIGLHVDERRN